MSEVRLVVREFDRDWSGTVPGGTADAAVAALSADPATFVELEAACARYKKPLDGGRLLPFFLNGLRGEPYDAGIVILDLAAHMVVIDSTYSSPGPSGELRYHDGRCETEIVISYHLADDWHFTHDIHSWRVTADRRRRERAANPPLDFRAALFGRPPVEFIAREVFAAYERREAVASEVRARWVDKVREIVAWRRRVDPVSLDLSHLSEEELHRQVDAEDRRSHPYGDVIKEIHARWLMTPRDELAGVTPRDASLERTQHLTWDLQDQEFRWSFVREAPPHLDPASQAYRYGGFGIHELVEYYYLIRHLLWSCWDRLADREKARRKPAGIPPTLMLDDFLTEEVPRLEAAREAWFDAPDLQSQNRTPRSIIECERIRLPLRIGAQHVLFDPDCACCRMAVDGPAPGFWHLDGCNMDDEFAFDIYNRTLADREQKDREREEFNREFNRRQALEAEERKRLGLEGSRYDRPEGHPLWSRNHRVGDAVDLPLGVRLFDLACKLAELITALRSKPYRMTEVEYTAAPAEFRETQPLIERLNRAFDNFRAVLDSEDVSLAATLIQPVIVAYADALSEVASIRPDLAETCEWLTNDVRNFLRPPPLDDVGYLDDMDTPGQ